MASGSKDFSMLLKDSSLVEKAISLISRYITGGFSHLSDATGGLQPRPKDRQVRNGASAIQMNKNVRNDLQDLCF